MKDKCGTLFGKLVFIETVIIYNSLDNIIDEIVNQYKSNFYKTLLHPEKDKLLKLFISIANGEEIYSSNKDHLQQYLIENNILVENLTLQFQNKAYINIVKELNIMKN